jgi:hypothetical protein
MEKYTTISLPYAFHKELVKIIKEFPEMGYSSIAEFVKEAVRIRIAEVQSEVRLIVLQRLQDFHYRNWGQRWDQYKNICRL